MTTHARPLVILFFCLLAAAPASAQPSDPAPPLPELDRSDPVAYGTALAQYAEDFDKGWYDSYARTTVTHTNAKGDRFVRKTRQMILESSEGDKSLLRFMAPADVRGVAVLNYAHPKGTDESWLYLPASRRVRRISGANRTASFLGTEFTYEDLSRIFTDQFDWKFLAEETITVNGAKIPVYRLEARPRYKATGYSKMILSLNRQHWRIEQNIFFDRAGRKLKTLTYRRWKQFHGRRWRATRIEMENHQTHASTSIDLEPLLLTLARYRTKDGKARRSLEEKQFTRRALEGRR